MKWTQAVLVKDLKTLIVAIIVFFISAGMIFFFQKDIGGKTLFMLSCLATSYYAYHNLNKDFWTKISKGILIGFATALFLLLIVQTIKAAISDSQWDFMCFYVQGLLGVHHLNFYDPNSFNILFKTIDFHPHYDNSFRLEILNVGLLSPPITMLFFAPLASFDFHTARIILSLLVFIFIIANAILANSIFLKNERPVFSLLFIFIIITVLPGTITTINYSQTNFFILFFLLLVIAAINKPVAGFYLALSIIIKPISGFLILYFILNKKWKPVICFFATLAALLFITGFIWGFHNITDFIYSSPEKRLPQYLYEQDVNQSLVGVINRNLKIHELTQNTLNIIYYLSAGFLIIFTCIISKKLNKIGNEYLPIMPFLLCMLIIYPSSLMHYMVYLIPLLIYFLFFEQEKKYFLAVLLLALSFIGTEAFFTYIVLWFFLLFISLFYVKRKNKKDLILSTKSEE